MQRQERTDGGSAAVTHPAARPRGILGAKGHPTPRHRGFVTPAPDPPGLFVAPGWVWVGGVGAGMAPSRMLKPQMGYFGFFFSGKGVF